MQIGTASSGALQFATQGSVRDTAAMRDVQRQRILFGATPDPQRRRVLCGAMLAASMFAAAGADPVAAPTAADSIAERTGASSSGPSAAPTDTTTALAASGEQACERGAVDTCRFADPVTGLLLAWPNDWPVRRLKLLTDSGPAAHARQTGAVRWISLEYVPDDPAQPEASVFHLAVLGRSDWIAQSNASRSPADVEVATGDVHVAVAAVQTGNPYPLDSRDADIFDALRPTLAEISRIVWFGVQVTKEDRR